MVGLLSTTRKIFRLNALGLSISLAIGSSSIWAAETIEFNIDVLDVNDRSNIDLSQFSRGGYIMPGAYTMAIHINKDDIPEQVVNFFHRKMIPKEVVPVCHQSWLACLV